MTRLFCVPLLALLVTVETQAAFDFVDPVDQRFDVGNYLAENAYGFLPVPILITEPAVGYGFGVAGVFLHESEAEKEQRKVQALASFDGGAKLLPPAATVAGALGTENGTWFAFAGHRRTWGEDKIRYLVGGGAGEAKLDIYTDLGGLLPGGGSVKFDTQTDAVVLMQTLQFRLGSSPLLLGVKQLFVQSTLSSSNAIVDGFFRMTGLDSSTNSGLGVVATYDTRNNIFFPTGGFEVNAEYMVHDDAIGADYDYQTLLLEGEGYLPLAHRWSLALAGRYETLNSSDLLPPTLNPYIHLRGISMFRYQGEEVGSVQAQLMYQLDNRWTLLGFYGIGQTRGASSERETADAYGGGFRYQIARRYGIHMGVDLAFSDSDTAFYITVGTGI
ncbi:outer membrane protein assembly factor [Ferrimonas balearica]|uniref:BamA/TamA family outer membrane protein n=1 Tax=Ferrimonas balearica TaxID=44012 RepID=UPI001C598686|nr:BamA/TamA family outer membrane protein [Ferrimonas balearica]MBW3138623.1 outer membrane protein assembly factor [Ferrimonas balearica]MBY6105684.1 outer membrane protein assembly factor [Ferrimonas balearica]